jgi:hypothetical protein
MPTLYRQHTKNNPPPLTAAWSRFFAHPFVWCLRLLRCGPPPLVRPRARQVDHEADELFGVAGGSEPPPAGWFGWYK